MKKTIALLAVGLIIGYGLSTNSDVKAMVNKGKRKVKEMLD